MAAEGGLFIQFFGVIIIRVVLWLVIRVGRDWCKLRDRRVPGQDTALSGESRRNSDLEVRRGEYEAGCAT